MHRDNGLSFRLRGEDFFKSYILLTADIAASRGFQTLNESRPPSHTQFASARIIGGDWLEDSDFASRYILLQCMVTHINCIELRAKFIR